MYLISLYFDKHTNKTITNHIENIADVTHNTFMIDNNVPPHLTLMAFDCKHEQQVIEILQSYFYKQNIFNIDFMSAGLFPSVIYLSPILNIHIYTHSQNLYDTLKPVETIKFSNKYIPFQYMPHTTIAKTLSNEQLILGSEYIAKMFNPIRGKVIRVSLSKTNPYTDLISFNLKEHQ